MPPRFLPGLGRTMIALGVILGLFVTFQLWGTGYEESRSQDALAPELVAGPSGGIDDVSASLRSIDPTDVSDLAVPSEGDSLGIIQLEPGRNEAGIDMRKVFIEGTDKDDLKQGPGHYMGTPFPGQSGNAAIAGHRVTYGSPFHRIDELVPGDLITVLTRQGEFFYEVMAPPADFAGEKGPAHWIVDPSDTSVLEDFGDDRLTLTACHPKYSAKQRIIVAAKLVGAPANTTAGTDTAPAELADSEEPAQFDDLGWRSENFPKALAWSVAAVAVWLAAALLGKLIGPFRWIVYLAATPAFFYCLWFAFTWINQWVPSL